MRKPIYLAGAALVAIATPQAAAAQDDATSTTAVGADIVVTATRREQRLQEVPLAVTALSGETLRSRGIENMNDLGPGKIAGLTSYPLNGSETGVALQMRGYGTSDASQGTQDNAVAFYIDGINIPRAQGGALDLVTPERIEVLRGPQGQLFGRNAEAGVVQVVSRRPTGILGGDFRAGIGNFDAYELKGRLDLPSLAGFNIQLSGMFRKRGGYFRNVRSSLLQNITPVSSPYSSFHWKTGNYDQDFRKLKTYGGRIAVERDFGDLNVFYAYDNIWAKDDQAFPQILVSPNAGTIENPNGGITVPPSGPATIFTTDGGRYQQQPLDLDHYPRSAPFAIPSLYFITKNQGHVLNLSYGASDSLTLKSITGLRKSLNYGGAVTSLGTSPVQAWASNYLDSKVFSQELQAIYTVSNFNITVGGIYFHEDVRDERDSGFSTNCPAGIPGAPCTPGAGPSRAPYYSPFAPNGGFIRQFSKTNAYAAYGQASWTPPVLEEKLELTAGLRYSDDTKRARRDIFNGVILPNQLRNEAKEKRVDPAFVVKYSWTDDINTYFRYASGFRDGGANVRSQTFVAYDTEVLKSFEIGLKSQWFDRRVTLNIAAFRYKVTDQQQSIQTNPSVNPSISDTFNVNVPYKAKGFEVELSARIVPGLSVAANYTFIDANERIIGIDPVTLKTFTPKSTSILPAGPCPAAPSGNCAGGLVVSPEDMAAHPNSTFLQLLGIGAARHSGSVSVDFSQRIDPGIFNIHFDWTRSSSMICCAPYRLATFINATGTVQSPAPRYNPGVSTNRINARMSFSEIPLRSGVKGELSFWVKNLLNHVDLAQLFPAGNALNASQPYPQAATYLQPPRTMGGEFRIQF
jgi:iron complex outermembrane receptor protein